MKKCKFTYFYSLSFNDKYFVVLYNVKYGLYLLEINERGDILYPQYEDYIEYYKSHHNSTLDMIYNISSTDNVKSTLSKTPNNILDKIKSIKKSSKNGIEIVPKIIRNGSLILLTSALALLAGCEKKDIQNKEIIENTTIESEQNKEPEIQLESEPIKYLHFGEITIPYEHEKYNDTFQRNVIYCDNVDEFKSYIKMETNPTYDDIRKTFQENSEIPDDIKNIIIKGLPKMETEFPDLDLSILYYNAKRMKCIAVSSDEMKSMGSDSSAFFFSLTGEVYYDKNEPLTDFTIDHEVLGHGSTEAFFDNNENIIYSGFNVKVFDGLGANGGVYDSTNTGKMLAEGMADIIAKKTSGYNQGSTYAMGQEAFRIIAELNGQTISEVINSRGTDLYENMYQLGKINNPVEYIVRLNSLYQDWMYGNLDEGENRLSDFFEELVFDSMDERIEKEGKNACIDAVTKILEEDTYYPDGIELWYRLDEDENRKIIESYNPHESSKSFEEKIKDLDHNKTNENDEMER